MALTEGLKVKMPGAGGAEIDLNGLTVWSLQELELGNPPKRDEMISSTDAHGSLPARVPFRDNRTVTARIQLKPQATMDAALAAIGDLEAMLEAAEPNAGSLCPPLDTVRFIYTPANSTKTFTLPIYQAAVEDIPKVVQGDDAGWFLNAPILRITAACDPFGYGALGTYLDATTPADVIGSSVTVHGGPGDAPPWLRTKFKDVATRLRGRLVVGVKKAESMTSPAVLSTAMTPIAGSIVSGFMTATTSEWQVAAQVPRENRTGNFRFYLTTCFSLSSGQVRLSWAEAGGARRTLPAVDINGVGVADILLGDISAAGPWDAWIEVKGDARWWSRMLVPTDSLIEVVGPMAGRQLAGATVQVDDLATTSTHLSGRTMTTGGPWSLSGASIASPTWPVASDGAARTVVSMASPGAHAIAGTGNYLDVEVRAQLVTHVPSDLGIYDWSKPVHGIEARRVDDNNFLVAGWAINGAREARPGLWTKVGGTYNVLWLGPSYPILNPWLVLVGIFSDWTLQATSDGRWFVSVEVKNGILGGTYWSASKAGANGLLIAGEPLGAATARTGIHDWWDQATPVMTRKTRKFRVSNLAAVTPPPIPSGATLKLEDTELLTAAGAKYPYVGSSGLTILPDVDNNLTVFTRRSADRHKDSSSANADPLDIDIEGYPRFLSVPH